MLEGGRFYEHALQSNWCQFADAFLLVATEALWRGRRMSKRVLGVRSAMVDGEGIQASAMF